MWTGGVSGGMAVMAPPGIFQSRKSGDTGRSVLKSKGSCKASIVLVATLLLSAWAALLVVINVVASLVQIFGAMTLLGIKLSAIPAVILILGVGLIVCFTVRISLVSCFWKFVLSSHSY